jgi:hypothetical protein
MTTINPVDPIHTGYSTTRHTDQAVVTGTNYGSANRSCTHWRTIFAGVVVAMSVQLVLTLVGAGIGLAATSYAVDSYNVSDAAEALTVGVLIWTCVSGLISFAAGGFVAAYLSYPTRPARGCTQGLIVWSATTVLGLILVALGGSSILNAASNAVPTVASAAERYGYSNTSMGRSATDDTTATGMNSAQTPGLPGSTTTSTTGDSASQATNSDRWASGPGNGSREVDLRDAASEAARYTSRASLFAAVALCIGAIGAVLGGYLGRLAQEGEVGVVVRTN